MSAMDLLKQWLSQQYTAGELPALQALNGDAGFRQYYRLVYQKRSYIAVYAPPATEKNREFVSIAKALKQAGVCVPEVLAYDFQQGFLLLSDLGDDTLLSQLNAHSVEPFYRLAMKQIGQMQDTQAQLPAYDDQALALELSYFEQWFLQALLGYRLNQQEQALWQNFSKALIDSALEQPQVFVHRDYHSRNIMLQQGALACIDFQDALTGACTYDLVSLLRDCYIVWPDDLVQNLSEQFRQDYYADIDAEQFKRWFDWMGLQRHIKVLGIFARLALRDGKRAYLNDLPTVIAYVQQVAKGYAQTAEFATWFEHKIMPEVKKQAWWPA